VCVCALWTDFTIGAFNRLASCYSKCIKCLFGYPKYSSVTNMLFELGLPSFNTVIHNSKVGFANRMSGCDNAVVRCVLPRVRFEPERTGTPFLFFFDHRNAVPVLFGI